MECKFYLTTHIFLTRDPAAMGDSPKEGGKDENGGGDADGVVDRPRWAGWARRGRLPNRMLCNLTIIFLRSNFDKIGLIILIFCISNIYVSILALLSVLYVF